MKRDTQKSIQEHARRPRKMLQLAKETLRLLNGGGRPPVVEARTTFPSQCPTLCF
jgi:hypothetical protein